ncbi:MAG: hypothetical protein KC443_01245 [Anaerolineales bacterium]|nr:hypothetical protein [Anaerolineales bacterium]
MCGIAATLLTPQARSASLWDDIWQDFTENLLINEKRGPEATGVALLHKDGRLRIVKQAVAAHEFVKTAVFQALRQQLDAETVLLLGHTRYPTQGSPQIRDNNHPIQVGSVFGVHNGRIHNDRQLFAQAAYPRRAQVDSEIIFQLLQPHSPAQTTYTNYLQTIQTPLQQLEGDFTFLAADCRAPGHLLLVKHHQPMSVYYHAQWSALIFSSRYIFLRKKFGQRVRNDLLLPDQLILYDAMRVHEQQQFPVATLPLYSAVEGGCGE